MTRALTPMDWARCSHYTSRIQRLGCLRYPFYIPSGYYRRFPIDSLEVDPSIFHALSHTDLTFPGLLELEWAEPLEIFPCIDFFLGPSVTILNTTIPKNCPDDTIQSLARVIHISSPALQDLRIRGSEGLATPKICEAISKLVRKLGHLRVLQCNYILSNETIRYLAIFPQLEELHITNTADNITRCMSVNQPSFRSVQHFTLQSRRLVFCTQLIKSMGISNQISSLDVYLSAPEPPREYELRQFFQTLVDFLSTDLFNSVHIFNSEAAVPPNKVWDSNYYVVTLATIQPLLSFRKLEGLDINLECPFDLDNSALHLMGVAWPRMRQLHLSQGEWGRPLKITLDGLVPLVQLCPELDSLNLCLNAVTSNPLRVRLPDNWVSNTKVTYMHLGTSTFENSSHVVAFLSDLFPNLDTISGWERGEYGNVEYNNWMDRWEDVVMRLRKLARIRKESIIWRKNEKMVSSAQFSTLFYELISC